MASNTDVIRAVEEAWNGNRLDDLDQYFAPTFVSHAAVPMLPPGMAGAKLAHQASIQAFPDRRITIQHIFGEGDLVCLRTTMTGTNQGGLPWIGAPANGKAVQGVEAISIYRLEGGKIVEHWGQNDVMSLMMQLGVGPGAQAGAPA